MLTTAIVAANKLAIISRCTSEIMPSYGAFNTVYFKLFYAVVNDALDNSNWASTMT